MDINNEVNEERKEVLRELWEMAKNNFPVNFKVGDKQVSTNRNSLIGLGALTVVIGTQLRGLIKAIKG